MRYARQNPCADYYVDKLSRAALNAAVVRVESVSHPTDPRLLPTAQVKLLRMLGGRAAWNGNQWIDMTVADGDPIILRAVKGRLPLIVLFPESPRENVFEPYPCGLIPFSEQNEKGVAAGVSAGTGIPEYD